MLNRLTTLRAKRASSDNGFTLIELLVVVVIIGVLIAIAIPLYLNYQKGANDKAAQSDVRNALTVMETCLSENGKYPSALAATGGTPTDCSSQSVKVSEGTTLTYSSATPFNSYKIIGYNSSGNTSSTSGVGYKVFCYNSATGGSVKAITGAATSFC